MKESTDVVILGGGVMGSAIACFLSAHPAFQGRIVVLEPDPSYRRAASALSTSGVRQQFSTATNIRLAQFTCEFLSSVDEYLAIDATPTGIVFHQNGYLYLGSAAQTDGFRRNNRLQTSLGVEAALLAPAELQARFPWMTVGDLEIGSFGAQDGWTDGYLLTRGFRAKARAQGVTYRETAATGIRHAAGRVLGVTCADGTEIDAGHVVDAAGGAGATIAGWLGVALPIRNVKQSVFVFQSPFAAPDMPFTFTPDGLFFRPEGADYIAGLGIAEDAPEALDFEVDHALFEEEVWPRLAHRVPAFENLRQKGAWAGHYDMNLFDHNAVVGRVPGIEGFVIANGFSGHGMMQAPGVGRGLAELIALGRYDTLDLSDLGITRILEGQPIREHIQY